MSFYKTKKLLRRGGSTPHRLRLCPQQKGFFFYALPYYFQETHGEAVFHRVIGIPGIQVVVSGRQGSVLWSSRECGRTGGGEPGTIPAYFSLLVTF